jgi:serine/threonine protein kinase
MFLDEGVCHPAASELEAIRDTEGPMQTGLIIAPNLKLVRPLGGGGMGTVWAAEHAALGREVAVKFLSEDLASDPFAVARFEREAMAVAELENEHIVKVIEFGFTDSGLPFMVTDLLEGENLGERLVREGRIAPDVVATILDQICDALASAHDLGIVHRDIKPENVFVMTGQGPSDAQPSIRLLDFGIAKHWRDPRLDVTGTGVAVGTPQYMSPEQLLSAKHVDFRADLWSLGVLAYRAVTGRLPFEATGFAALCIKIHRGVFTRASAYDASLSPGLDAWFTKALRGHPAARFSSAREMTISFRAALTTPTSVELSFRSHRVPPPRNMMRRQFLWGKLASQERTAEGDDTIGGVRRRPIAWVALVAFAMSIAIALTIGPSEIRKPEVVAVRSAGEPVQIEPSEPSKSAPVVSTLPMGDVRSLSIVPRKSNATPSLPKRTPPALSPAKEPDRGF